MSTVLVTGATGFIGRRLVPALLDAGHDVRAMTRRPDDYDGPGEPVGGDVFDADSLGPRRSTASTSRSTSSTPSTTPTSSARTPTRPAPSALPPLRAGVQQIVYMGGLGDEGEDLSPHLRSRREVEELLGSAGVPVTVLRAAIVVGARRASRGRSPASWSRTCRRWSCPQWVGTRTQPIALDDVVRYLAGVVGERGGARPGLRDRRPGGADLPRDAAGRRARDDRPHAPDRRRPAAHARACRRAGWRWSPTSTSPPGRNLIDSMGTEVVVRRPLDPRRRAGRAAVLPRGRTPCAGRARGVRQTTGVAGTASTATT